MSTEFAQNQETDAIQEAISGADIELNLEFLRSAGLLDLPNPGPNTVGILDAVRALAADVSEKMECFGQRLAALESGDRASPEVRSSTTLSFDDAVTPAPEVRRLEQTPAPEVRRIDRSTPLLWADRPAVEAPDYNEVITWPDDEEENGGNSTKLFAVSENTSKVLTDSFLKGLSNPSRRQMREKFGDPRCPPTRVQKLDKIVKDRMSQEAAKMDKTLARLQALFLDIVGPLASILEDSEKGELTIEKATIAAKTALRFAGNASVQKARERRRRAITEMNPKLTELAEKDDIYESAAPMLFGDRFAKEAKEREEQLRCLDRASGRGRSQNFQYRRPLTSRRGGGISSGGRHGYGGPPSYNGRGRFHPYTFKNPQFRGKENYPGRGRGKQQ